MKPNEPLWRISVSTAPEAEDAVSELLSAVTGQGAVAYFQAESQTSQVSAFVEAGEFAPLAARWKIAAGLAHIRRCGLDTGAATVEMAPVKREDWAESWKRHFKPMEIRAPCGPDGRVRPGAPSVLIKPSWSGRRARKHQATVILDPGLSFGTGHHPTTSFCLQEVVRGAGVGETRSLLDIGTGSGILAIAAVKLGYAPVVAFDFDPEAVRVAGANARRNRVARRLSLRRDDVAKLPLRPAQRFDLVCANLISSLLMAERRRLVSQLKPGGRLVLAGILASEFTQVQETFADLKMELCNSRTENEWRSGVFCLI